jgi:hypothetical protein
MSLKRLILILLFCVLALPAKATTYYLAVAGGGGSDSNNGTSPGTPWLSPNHALNCGDVIIAAASTSYSATNFQAGKWGTVTCPAGNNVAWLKCATFDACKITTSSQDGMRVDKSYWGIQGWEVTITSGASGSSCFSFITSSSATIHHYILANNVANQCYGSGFNSFNSSGGSEDYVTIIGNIFYKAAQGAGTCNSAISIYQPTASDTNAGTHMYVAGNFAWLTLNPNPCAGSTPTDGELVIFDTFDGSQSSGVDYAQQAVAYNNIGIANGGRCVEIFNNKAGANHATIYVEYNTCYSNNDDPNQLFGPCGDIEIGSGFNTTITANLVQTGAATACGATNLYAYEVANSAGSTNSIAGNWGYSAAGNNCGIVSSAGFSCGTNAFGTSPSFTSASTPGAPSCGSATSTVNCMATVIANFVPTASGSTAYGYQAVSNTSRVDALYPAWLCTVTNLPVGLVTPGCGVAVNNPPVSGVTIQ